MELFKKSIEQLNKTTAYLTFYFQGEPYLNPDFLEMIKIADENYIFTSTSTNAHFLNKETALKTVRSGLKRIIVSIDGSSQEVYEQYRVGGTLTKVIEGTKNLVDAKRELNSIFPKIVFQFLVVKPNEHQINDLRKLAKKIGVDQVKLKTAQIYDFENGNALIPENDKYSRYKKGNNGKYYIKNALLNKCWKLWNSCVITWDGKVLPCCFDKDAQFEMGNIKDQTFELIWQNNKYKQFREQLIRSRQEISICKNCSEGLKVWDE
jgi:radical SAM protein with 4Fe4S-binding SPASM domain